METRCLELHFHWEGVHWFCDLNPLYCLNGGHKLGLNDDKEIDKFSTFVEILRKVNCLRLVDVPISSTYDLLDGQFFDKLLALVSKNGSSHSEGPNGLERVETFFKCKFPDYHLSLSGATCDPVGVTLFASVMLGYVSLVTEDCGRLLRTPLFKLNHTTQCAIHSFLEAFLGLHQPTITPNLVSECVLDIDSETFEGGEKLEFIAEEGETSSPLLKSPLFWGKRSLTSELRSLRNQVDLLKCEKSHLLEELEVAKQGIADLQTDVKKKESEILHLGNELFVKECENSVQSSCGGKRREKRKSTGGSSGAAAILVALERKWHKQEIESLDKVIAELRVQLESATATKEELQDKVTSLEREVKEWAWRFDESESRNQALQSHAAELEVAFVQLKATYEEQSCLIAESKSNEMNDSGSLALLVNESGSVETMAAVIDLQYLELQQQYDNQTNELLKTNKFNEELVQMCDTLKTELELKTLAVTDLTQQLVEEKLSKEKLHVEFRNVKTHFKEKYLELCKVCSEFEQGIDGFCTDMAEKDSNSIQGEVNNTFSLIRFVLEDMKNNWKCKYEEVVEEVDKYNTFLRHILTILIGTGGDDIPLGNVKEQIVALINKERSKVAALADDNAKLGFGLESNSKKILELNQSLHEIQCIIEEISCHEEDVIDFRNGPLEVLKIQSEILKRSEQKIKNLNNAFRHRIELEKAMTERLKLECLDRVKKDAKEIDDISAKCKQLTNVLVAKEESLRSLEVENARLQGSCHLFEKNLQTTISHLSGEISHKTKKIQELNAIIETYRTIVEANESKVRELEANNSVIITDIARLKNENQTLAHENRTHLEMIGNLNSIIMLNEKDLNQLHTQVGKINERNSMDRESRKSEQIETTALREDAANLNKMLILLKQEIKEVYSMKDQEIELKSNLISEMTASVEKLKSDLAIKTTEVERLGTELKKSSQEFCRQSNEIEGLKCRLEDSKSEVANYNECSLKLEKILSQFLNTQGELSVTKKGCTNLQSTCANLECVLALKSTELDALVNTVKVKDIELGKFEETFKMKETELQSLKEALEERDAKVQDLTEVLKARDLELWGRGFLEVTNRYQEKDGMLAIGELADSREGIDLAITNKEETIMANLDMSAIEGKKEVGDQDCKMQHSRTENCIPNPEKEGTKNVNIVEESVINSLKLEMILRDLEETELKSFIDSVMGRYKKSGDWEALQVDVKGFLTEAVHHSRVDRELDVILNKLWPLMTKRMDQLTAMLREARDNLSASEIQIDSLKSINECLRCELVERDEKMAADSDIKMQKVWAELDMWKDESERLRETIELLGREDVERMNVIDGLTMRVVELTGDVETKEREINELKAEIHQLTEDHWKMNSVGDFLMNHNNCGSVGGSQDKKKLKEQKYDVALTDHKQQAFKKTEDSIEEIQPISDETNRKGVESNDLEDARENILNISIEQWKGIGETNPAGGSEEIVYHAKEKMVLRGADRMCREYARSNLEIFTEEQPFSFNVFSDLTVEEKIQKTPNDQKDTYVAFELITSHTCPDEIQISPVDKNRKEFDQNCIKEPEPFMLNVPSSKILKASIDIPADIVVNEVGLSPIDEKSKGQICPEETTLVSENPGTKILKSPTCKITSETVPDLVLESPTGLGEIVFASTDPNFPNLGLQGMEFHQFLVSEMPATKVTNTSIQEAVNYQLALEGSSDPIEATRLCEMECCQSSRESLKVMSLELIKKEEEIAAGAANVEALKEELLRQSGVMSELMQNVQMFEHEKVILEKRIEIMAEQLYEVDTLKQELLDVRSKWTVAEGLLQEEQEKVMLMTGQVTDEDKLKSCYDAKLSTIESRLKLEFEEHLQDITREFTAKIEQYKEKVLKDQAHIEELSSQLWEASDKFLVCQQQVESLRSQLNKAKTHNQLLVNEIVQHNVVSAKQRSMSLQQLSTSGVGVDNLGCEDSMDSGDSIRREVAMVVTATPQRTVQEPLTSRPKYSLLSGKVFPTADEEEIFDERCLSNLKAGICHFPLVEGSKRSSCTILPKIVKLKEQRVKDTESLIPSERPKKHKLQITYRKPGPPTPCKNSGRLSLQGNERLTGSIKSESSSQHAQNGTSDGKQPRQVAGGTPHRGIKNLFGSKSKINQDSPRPRRLSFFQRKFKNRENVPP